MSMSFSDATTELDIILGDAADVTFNTSEKERALTKAWNDPYVVDENWDTSLSYTSGTYRYAKPSGVDSIQDIYISTTGSTNPMPDPIDADLWDDVNGYIQFSSKADSVISSTYTLYIKSLKKLTVSDSIEDTNLQEYVLALAGAYTLKLLAHKKANLFTKNDVSMAELIGLKRELENDVISLRRSLRRRWESA